jgi:cbb3-type cytochrome oxidase subunit 3
VSFALFFFFKIRIDYISFSFKKKNKKEGQRAKQAHVLQVFFLLEFIFLALGA